jgi:hypothetical protein
MVLERVSPFNLIGITRRPIPGTDRRRLALKWRDCGRFRRRGRLGRHWLALPALQQLKGRWLE